MKYHQIKGWQTFIFFLIFLSSSAIYAQNSTPSTSFQLQQFRPWGDSEGLFQTQSAQTLGQWGFSLGVFGNYGYQPLRYRQEGSTLVNTIVEHQVGLDVTLGLGLFSWLDIAVQIPMSVYQMGTIPSISILDTGIHNRSLDGFAMSDPKVQLKIQMLREKAQGINLAIQGFVGIPVGDKERLNGEEPVTAGGSILFNKNVSIVNFALNVGYRYLPPSTFGNLNLNHELSYSAGLGITVLPGMALIGELSGATLISEAININQSPLEAYGGFRFMPLKNTDFGINLGAAMGLTNGYGAPTVRGLLGLVYSPKNRDKDGDGVEDGKDKCPDVKGPRENNGCPWGDADGDGIHDGEDKCPNQKGPRENEGCPWGDIDGDGLHDGEDKCPKDKGPKENKGCPWSDTDGDGLHDGEDKCPSKKGPKENNGCPWGDTDGDGLHDGEDKCPKEKGPKENKGCPEKDSDKDGIVNRLDKCPYVKGTPNTKDPSKHGCPKVVLVKVTKEEIKILQKIRFKTGSSRILRRSYPILNQVVAVMNSRPEIKINIQGHTDNRGGVTLNKRLSERRALSVRRYLIGKNIKSNRLTSQGFGMSQPLVPNTNRTNRARNRRVEFKVSKNK